MAVVGAVVVRVTQSAVAPHLSSGTTMRGESSPEERRLELARRLLDGAAIDWEKEGVSESEVREGMQRLQKLLERQTGGTETDEAPPSSERFIGPFRVVRRLGEGGGGIVYEAEQQDPRRAIALKVIRGGAFVDEHQVKMFRREAQTLARLKHPSIAAIHAMGCTDEGQHFFAMELVLGETLGDWVARARAELRVRLGLFRKICDAVAYAHQRGVIHRDLKPSNILVLREPVGGSSGSGLAVPDIKILDFGLARITDTDVALSTLVSELGTVRGTLPYMSPEQVRGNPDEIDLRTDVYSLGVILYELLTGRLPYDVTRGSFPEAVRVICEEPPRPLTKTWEGTKKLDADVVTIAFKALEKESNRRYQSVAALGEDVQRYLSDQPILARPPSAGYQLRKLVARHKTVSGFIAALFVVLTVFAVTMTVQAGRIAAERDRANTERKASDRVSEFLANMLGEVKPHALGDTLWKDLRERVAEVRRGRGESKEQVTVALGSLDAALAGVNATSVALRLLDDQVLSRAGRTIEHELETEPRIALRLENTLGDTYRNLGLYGPAEHHAMRAVEIGKRVFGPDHPETLHSMTGLANVYTNQGRYDAAEKLNREALEVQRRILGPDHPDTLTSMHNLGAVLYHRGQYGAAEKIDAETLELRRRVLGLDHRDTLGTMNNLAIVYLDQGRYDQAEKLHSETLAALRQARGSDDPQTLGCMSNLANVYYAQGRYDEAQKLFREALEARRRVLGPAHPDTLLDMSNLANACERQGRYDEAEKLQRETLAISRQVLGPDHQTTLNSMGNLANVYLSQGRFDEALRLHRETVENSRRVLGPDHPFTLLAMGNLAVGYYSQGRHDVVEELLLEQLERRLRTLGADHPDTVATRYNVACIAALRGHREEALDSLSRAIEHGFKNADAMVNDGDLKSLRGDPLFEQLVARARENAADPK